MHTIEVKGLKHCFSKEELLLKGLDLQVPKGSIYGLLGKNGAGKTTTLKLILGLLKLQEGEILIFGEKLNDNRISILSRIGSLIESPSFYAHLTARENLKILQKIYQCPMERIDAVLELTGLAHTGKKKLRQFSLGMKQRLSIAIAMLHEPELLILDEPTNGLDPEGIIEIRELLKSINAQHGTTIIISSHLLAEVEKLVSHLAIMNQGELVFEGTLGTLRMKQQGISKIRITTDDPKRALEIVSEKAKHATIENGVIVMPSMLPQELANLIKTLVMSDVQIHQVINDAMDLESMFINLTKD